jgi:DNA-binding transcriptional LysR family regulator
MNINHLAIFHAVAEEGNLTRAAERLHISQPAVSKQLRELEKSLGMALFHRLSKGVRLTEGGELLAGYARNMFALEAEAEHALSELRGLERGRLTVGASTTIGTYLLPPVFTSFQQLYPHIELNLEIANTEEIQQRLLDNSIDLALSEGYVHAPDLQAEVIAWDEIVAIAAPDHPLLSQQNVTAQMLCEYSFVAREVGSGTRAVTIAALQEKGILLQPTMSMGSSEAVKRAVITGAGWALLSRLAIELELQTSALVIVPVEDLSIHRPFHRLRQRGKYESRSAREFVRMLRQSKS